MMGQGNIIKAALLTVLTALSGAQGMDAALLADVANCYREMPNEIRQLSRFEQDRIVAQRDHREVDTARPEYQRTVEIALMVLSAEGISLDHQGPDRSLNSFVLNLEEVVESYLRNALRGIVASDIVVEDGNKEGRRPLFKNQPNGPPAQPDMVLRRPSASSLVVGDVKYKTKIDRTDINQAITYAVTFATKNTVLIHIAAANGKRGHYIIGEAGDLTVYGYAFDLSATDLENEEIAMCNFLSSLV